MRVLTRFAVFLLLALTASSSGGSSSKGKESEIESFNRKFVELISKTDHAGMLAIWADDGVDLMPGEAPLTGKGAIAAWINDIESKAPGSRVSKEEVESRDIQVAGDWASEWATEHQIVQSQGKPPIEGYGKIALVLHRNSSGAWKINKRCGMTHRNPDICRPSSLR